MFNQPAVPNPFTPPAADLTHVEPFRDGLVWREGNLLYIRNGAALPNRCFKSGEETQIAVPVTQFSYYVGSLRERGMPSWVYWLLCNEIIPTPAFFGEFVKLDVPLSKHLYDHHRRRIGFGLLCLVAGVLLVVLAFYAALSWPALVFGAAAMVVGFGFASRSPLRLNIVDFSGDLLVLQDIHPNCLDVVVRRSDPTN